MKKLALFAATAGLMLVSAAPPPREIVQREIVQVVASVDEYPECSRLITDRCIQLNDRKSPARVRVASYGTYQSSHAQRQREGGYLTTKIAPAAPKTRLATISAPRKARCT
jgi:hypothetical protein